MITTLANPATRPDIGAALPHDDRPCRHPLPSVNLHSQIVGIGVPPVPRRPTALLVSHLPLPPLLDLSNLSSAMVTFGSTPKPSADRYDLESRELGPGPPTHPYSLLGLVAKDVDLAPSL